MLIICAIDLIGSCAFHRCCLCSLPRDKFEELAAPCAGNNRKNPREVDVVGPPSGSAIDDVEATC
jgi:hypothetical protein